MIADKKRINHQGHEGTQRQLKPFNTEDTEEYRERQKRSGNRDIGTSEKRTPGFTAEARIGEKKTLKYGRKAEGAEGAAMIGDIARPWKKNKKKSENRTTSGFIVL
jgi:hypothetical protein